MKLLAQMGAQTGSRISEGLTLGLIDGAVFAARYISPDSLVRKLNELRNKFPSTFLAFDPQYYIAALEKRFDPRLGSVDSYPYFSQLTRKQLTDSKNVKNVLLDTLRYQQSLPVDVLIAPNTVIRRSFDSAWAVISDIFVRNVRNAAKKLEDRRPVFATLAISHQALADEHEFDSFLNDLVELSERPDGFYLLFDCDDDSSHADDNPKVVSNILMLSHTLKSQGYQVVHGYCDFMIPAFAALGSEYSCSGWFRTMRRFSLDNYHGETGGGRRPLPQYFSNTFLSRVPFRELTALEKQFPTIRNNTNFDKTLDERNPDSLLEALQNWDAMKSMVETIPNGSVSSQMTSYLSILQHALKQLEVVSKSPLKPSFKPGGNGEHLQVLIEGLQRFKETAELD